MRILITGVAGFIGQALAQRLLAREEEKMAAPKPKSLIV